jgi:hypothetical protein
LCTSFQLKALPWQRSCQWGVFVRFFVRRFIDATIESGREDSQICALLWDNRSRSHGIGDAPRWVSTHISESWPSEAGVPGGRVTCRARCEAWIVAVVAHLLLLPWGGGLDEVASLKSSWQRLGGLWFSTWIHFATLEAVDRGVDESWDRLS